MKMKILETTDSFYARQGKGSHRLPDDLLRPTNQVPVILQMAAHSSFTIEVLIFALAPSAFSSPQLAVPPPALLAPR
jgi:hypothetical protein